MLARAYRLRLGRDIDRVLRQGRYGASGAIWCKALAGKSADSRLAIVVSKKVSKKAVVRNRLRRRIAAHLATSWQTVRPGYDIVISARIDVSEIAQTELTRDIDQALAKAGILTSARTTSSAIN